MGLSEHNYVPQKSNGELQLSSIIPGKIGILEYTPLHSLRESNVAGKLPI